MAALTGNRGQVNYAAAKGALNAATKALSLEVASRGITVNAVAPGIIATGMGDARLRCMRHRRHRADEARRYRGRGRQPGGYLASEEAGYITGQIISVNGGMI